MSMVAAGVTFAYESAPILHAVGLELGPGEVVGIIGPNGSGKTTLLKCLNRILEPAQGEVLLHDQDLARMSRVQIARSIGYVPQGNGHTLADPTVFEVVLMGRRPHSTWSTGNGDAEKVWGVLDSLGLVRFASQRFHHLSGGEKQRVLIARALVQEARILLLDEPTSSLDVRHQIDVMDLLTQLVRARSLSVCAIMHDLDLAIKYCDKVVMMKDGAVFASGPSREVITTERVRAVYDVEVVIDERYGRLHVVVL